MATAGVPEFVACVVGLSRTEGEEFTRGRGIGKSCLCHRFVHHDRQDYVDEHQSLLALHEFTSPVINSIHFLYWGSVVKSFAASKSSSKSSKVHFHVIEHTVFYQDETSKPFSAGSKPDNLTHYVKRITGSIESPGKLSYQSRDDIESSCEKQQYPVRLSRIPRGFLVVLDVSLSGEKFETQFQQTEQILDHLVKQRSKFVVVVTKRDRCDVDSLESALKLKRKYHCHVIETSASTNRNVLDAFRVLARTTLQKKVHGVSDTIPTYEEPELSTIKPKHNLKQKLSPKHVARRYKDTLTVEGGKKRRRRSKELSTATENIVTNGSVYSDSELSDFPDEEGNPHYTSGAGSDVDLGDEIFLEADNSVATSPDLRNGSLGTPDSMAQGHVDDARSEFKGQIESPVEIRVEPAAIENSSPEAVSDGEGGGRKSGFWKDWHKIKRFDNKKKKKERAKSPAGVEQEPLLLLNED